MRRLLDVLSRVETLQEIVEGGVCSSLTKTSDMCGQRSAMLASFCSRRRVRHFSVERESRLCVCARGFFSLIEKERSNRARARKRRCSRTLVGSCGRVFNEVTRQIRILMYLTVGRVRKVTVEMFHSSNAIDELQSENIVRIRCFHTFSS